MPRDTSNLKLACAIVLVGCVACSADTEEKRPRPTCNLIGLATFVVKVVDSVTGAEICDATVSYTTETTQGTLTASAPPKCEYVGPFEMPGTYEVVATKAGYQAESVTLAVGQDECGHVVTQRPTLSLSPQ